ncbi:hypothetical protein [Tenacibaculum sp. C7A-26P2]|uniref:hypothetical protein n=1 Tax=Tenacibaculum sp. C7A-26P2 TaxID=3447504 RepID=UPI003F868C11
MPKLILVLILFLLVSCTKDEDLCNCTNVHTNPENLSITDIQTTTYPCNEDPPCNQ